MSFHKIEQDCIVYFLNRLPTTDSKKGLESNGLNEGYLWVCEEGFNKIREPIWNIIDFPYHSLIMEIMQNLFFNEFMFFARECHVSKTHMMHM
jgi:hypothetical protein